ncbi:MAG: hypothetical protein QOE19_2815, partial [Actinomycetota bacterium]|nr:hypothetical protein [Actinomycetota bacterium]
ARAERGRAPAVSEGLGGGGRRGREIRSVIGPIVVAADRQAPDLRFFGVSRPARQNVDP